VKEVRRKTPTTGRRSADADGLSPVAALVRRHDRDRFQTALFAPTARREALFALYAFNYEIARVRESVTEPMLGQIRLQWWRENIAAAFGGAPVRHHPVVETLTNTIRELALSREHFDRMIDARETDLSDEPPATLAALEDYGEATSAQLVFLALEALGVRDKAAGEVAHHVGIAYALAGLLRAMPFHARTGRCVIPTDLARRTSFSEEDYRGLRSTPALRAATAAIATAATHHLAAARSYRGKTPRPAIPALLPAVIARRWLVRLKGVGHDPFEPALLAPDPLQSWRLAVAALLRRF
jgi:NADH dehydrogenase [ubiquinone] 1 alpha subcomplex assembly factor 6